MNIMDRIIMTLKDSEEDNEYLINKLIKMRRKIK